MRHLNMLRGLAVYIFKKPFMIDEIERRLDDGEKKPDPDSKLSDLPLPGRVE